MSVRRWRRAGFLAVVAPLLLWPAPAGAHVSLAGTEPADGATVAAVDRVVLRFAGAVEAGGVSAWLDGNGRLVPLRRLAARDGEGTAVAMAVPALGDGAYRVMWRVTAGDGATVEGAVSFTVVAAAHPRHGTDPEPVPGTAPGSRAGPTPHPDRALLGGVLRALVDASLGTLIGGFAFLIAVWPRGGTVRGARRVLMTAAVVAAAATVTLAGLQLAAAGAPPLASFLGYGFGRVAAARLVLLVAAVVLAAQLGGDATTVTRSRRWCTGVVVVALALAESVSLLGHEGTPGTLAATATLVHAVGVTAWVGGLVMLLAVVFPRRRSDELAAVLPAFSRVAGAGRGSLPAWPPPARRQPPARSPRSS